MPSPQATVMVRGESSGSRRLISSFDTTAWTTADKKKPRMRAHKSSQAMLSVMRTACSIAGSTMCHWPLLGKLMVVV